MHHFLFFPMKLALYFMGPALCVQVSMPFNLKHTWCFVLHCVLCVTPDPNLVPHGQHKDEQQALFGIIKLTGLRTQGGACPLLGTGPYVQGLYLEKNGSTNVCTLGYTPQAHRFTDILFMCIKF